MRYLLTLWRFWYAAVAAEMEYRANFLVSIIGSVMLLGIALYSIFIFYRTGYEMGDWTYAEATMVVGLFTILSGLQGMLLAPNRMRVTELVREGTLDFVLLKPMDTQFWLSVRSISIWSFPDILLGTAVLVWAGSFAEDGPGLGIWDYVKGLPAVMLGLLVLYALGFILSTLTVWFVKLFNITMAMDALLEAGRYPIAAYPRAYQLFFTFVIPVAFMTTVPAAVMLERTSAWLWLAIAAGFAAVLLLMARLFWKFAMRYYTSASS